MHDRKTRERVFVLGATGGTGKAFVEIAISRGHDVTAFVRSPSKLGPLRDRVAVVEGDPYDRAALAAAMRGHAVVVTALGAPGLGPSTLLEDCARATVEAMRVADAKRLLVVSAAVLFENEGFAVWLARTTFLRNVAKSSRAMEDVVRESGLDHVILRPPRLTHGPLTGHYVLAEGRLPPGPRVVSRADVARALACELEERRFVDCVVGIAGERGRPQPIAAAAP